MRRLARLAGNQAWYRVWTSSRSSPACGSHQCTDNLADSSLWRSLEAKVLLCVWTETISSIWALGCTILWFFTIFVWSQQLPRWLQKYNCIQKSKNSSLVAELNLSKVLELCSWRRNIEGVRYMKFWPFRSEPRFSWSHLLIWPFSTSIERTLANSSKKKHSHPSRSVFSGYRIGRRAV